MCNVNYLIEIRRFNTFAARTRLPASAQLLWYKLIEIMNQHARGGDWCDGFLRIDNPYLLAYFPMSATALADARRTLCEAGLLEYIPGEKKRTPPAYRLHYFSVCDGKGAVERDYPREISADSTADCPEIRDYPRDNPNYPSVYPTDCTTDCTTDCHGNTPDFHDTNINYTETETENVNPTGKTNDDEKETSAFSAGYAGAGACTDAYACTGAGAREGAFPRSVRESAKLAGKVLLHQQFTENQLNRVMAAFGAYPFEDGLMIQAVAKTAEANPTNAVNYLIQLLTDWGGAGVRTVAEMEDYLYARDMAQGNALMHTREEGQALLAAFRAEHGRREGKFGMRNYVGSSRNLGEKSSLGARLRTRKVTGRDASLPAPLLAASLGLVGRGTVGALPQTPAGTLSLHPARGNCPLTPPRD